MSKEEYHVDHTELANQLIEEIQNKTINSALEMFLQDFPESEMILRLFRAANKHGVSTQTILAIIKEIMPEGGK